MKLNFVIASTRPGRVGRVIGQWFIDRIRSWRRPAACSTISAC